MLPFGFSWKLKGLRKKWCKLRLKALSKEKEEKGRLLDMLDNVEQDLRTLEEQELSRIDRGRIVGEVENGLKRVEEVMKSKNINTENIENYE